MRRLVNGIIGINQRRSLLGNRDTYTNSPIAVYGLP